MCFNQSLTTGELDHRINWHTGGQTHREERAQRPTSKRRRSRGGGAEEEELRQKWKKIQSEGGRGRKQIVFSFFLLSRRLYKRFSFACLPLARFSCSAMLRPAPAAPVHGCQRTPSPSSELRDVSEQCLSLYC